MAEIDYSLPDRRLDKLENKTRTGLKSGGGGDRFDPMEGRVKALEDGMARIEPKLDALVASVAELKGQVGMMPTAHMFGDLRAQVATLTERITHLPSKGFVVTSTLAALVVIAALVAFQGQIQAFHKIGH